MIDDRDDGKEAPAVANHRSTSGSSRPLGPPGPRALGAAASSIRPDFSDEMWLAGFFIESLFMENGFAGRLAASVFMAGIILEARPENRNLLPLPCNHRRKE